MMASAMSLSVSFLRFAIYAVVLFAASAEAVTPRQLVAPFFLEEDHIALGGSDFRALLNDPRPLSQIAAKIALPLAREGALQPAVKDCLDRIGAFVFHNGVKTEEGEHREMVAVAEVHGELPPAPPDAGFTIVDAPEGVTLTPVGVYTVNGQNAWTLVMSATDGTHPLYDRNEVHDIYREWRKVFNEYDPPAFAVAEAWVHPDRQYLYASPDELGQVFNFEFAKKDWIRDDMHLAIEEGLAAAERSGSTSTWVMSNHDVPRHVSRYGLPQVPASSHHQLAKDWLLRDGTSYTEDREKGSRRARAAILMELALPGSAYVYQGEELGLPEVADIPWDQLEDPTAFNSARSHTEKGRDGCRVPLPWVASDKAENGGSFGFSPAAKHAGAGVMDAEAGTPSEKPHLPQPAWFADYAADVEDANPDSMLILYRKALELRHKMMPADTTLTWLDEDRASDLPDGADGQHGGVIAYRRSNGWASITNFGATPVDLPNGEILLASAPLTDDGKLPQDATVWLSLD